MTNLIRPRRITMSLSERRLLRALATGEPLAQAAARLALSPEEAQEAVARIQQRAGVATRQALIARAVAHRWAA